MPILYRKKQMLNVDEIKFFSVNNIKTDLRMLICPYLLKSTLISKQYQTDQNIPSEHILYL